MAGSDYSSTSINATYHSGSQNSDIRRLDITILEDDALEPDQVFSVTLTTLDPNVAIGNNETTITIIDNDSQYCVAFVAIKNDYISCPNRCHCVTSTTNKC